MKGISNATNAVLMAQLGIVSKPYEALAASLAAHAVAESRAVQEVGKEKTSTWDLMKSAIKVARDNGHSHEVMRAGLEIACVNAKVPAGSFRGYMSTVESLATDLEGGNLTVAQINDISVKDARKRYAPAPTAEQAARTRLNDAIKGWSAEHIATLAQIAEDDNAKAAADAAAAEGTTETEVPAQARRAA